MLGHSDKNLQSVTVYAKLQDSAIREAAEASERKMLEEVNKATAIAERKRRAIDIGDEPTARKRLPGA